MATAETHFFDETLHRQAAHLAEVAADLNAARLAFATAKAAHESAVRDETGDGLVRAWESLNAAQARLTAIQGQHDTLRDVLTADLGATLKGLRPEPLAKAASRDREAGRAREAEATAHVRQAWECLSAAVDCYRHDGPTAATALEREAGTLTKNLDRETARRVRHSLNKSPGLATASGVPPVLDHAEVAVRSVLEVLDGPWLKARRRAATKTPPDPA